MFVYECIKTDGKHVGMCVDNFMFGSCCSHNITHNAIIPSTPPNLMLGGRPQYTNKYKPSKPAGFVTHPTKKPSTNHWFKEPIISTTVRTTTTTDSAVAASASSSTITAMSTTSQKLLPPMGKPNFITNGGGVHWFPTTEPNFVTRPRPSSNLIVQKPKPNLSILNFGMSSTRSNLTNHNSNKKTNSSESHAMMMMMMMTAVTTTTTSTTTTTENSKTNHVSELGTNQKLSSNVINENKSEITSSTSTAIPASATTTKTPTTSTTTTTFKATTETSSTTTASQSSHHSSTEQHSSKISKNSGQCGVASLLPRPEMRIVGGKNAPFGGWPWQVSVRRTSFFGFSSTHRCGGAVINENWIATAGHCVDDLLTSQIRIRVGEYDFSSVQEPYPFVERGISKKVVHPKYNFFTYEYDLALVRLESSLEFQPHIAPICLPASDDLLIGENATVTGWGRLSEGGTLPSVLQQVSVPIVSNDKCKSMFLRAGRHEFIPKIFLCAGYENGGQDSCQGDSGGPLQVKGKNGRYFLAGIISWGIGCAEANLPGVCTRISKFVPWILENVT
ncbi:predicted protein [Pediculus humanus corporis]|uniref:Predicted protein n=1 Tax=Pediculus humanus subsp. corporis TaxID=121224 RepID=E0W095_PEDHC|nr:uncharacterized protein Phum_PHUM547720 [Pediculus humanus corporis]EEB19051.1 predicted protein [Pediculus humanus corporis]